MGFFASKYFVQDSTLTDLTAYLYQLTNWSQRLLLNLFKNGQNPASFCLFLLFSHDKR